MERLPGTDNYILIAIEKLTFALQTFLRGGGSSRRELGMKAEIQRQICSQKVSFNLRPSSCQLQLNHFTGMSWTEQSPFFAYYYPFYDYPIAPHAYQSLLPLSGPFFCQKGLETADSIKVIRGLDTQPHLSCEKNDQKDSPELKKKAIRKQRILKRRERQDNFQRKKQKKDRNLPSNIFKYFISYLYGHPHLDSLLAAPSHAASSPNPASFVLKLKEIIKQTQSYIRPAVIQQLCYDSDLSEGEALVFRRVLKRFLLLELPVLVGPMQKYKKRQRRELINLARKLFQQIKEKAF